MRSVPALVSLFHRLGLLLLMFAILLAPAPPPALAIGTSLLVDPTANDKDDSQDGKCSLREALQAISLAATYHECNATGGEPYLITFKSVGTIKLLAVNALPDVSKIVVITGPVIIDGNTRRSLLYQ